MQKFSRHRGLESNPRPVLPPASSEKHPGLDDLGIINFRCPSTGAWGSSGIDTDCHTLLQIRHCRVRVHCRVCGQPHELDVASCELAPFGTAPTRRPAAETRPLRASEFPDISVEETAALDAARLKKEEPSSSQRNIVDLDQAELRLSPDPPSASIATVAIPKR
jgi:hypothetical protein